MELSASRERFGRDDFSRRLGAIAANLSRIRSFIDRGVAEPLIRSLIDESKMFIEDAARNASVEAAAEMVELQLLLARWSRAANTILVDDGGKREVARKAGEWSDRLLKMSGMLNPAVAGEANALVIPVRHKYGLIALPGVWASIDVVQIGDITLATRPPLELSEWWIRRVGEHYSEVFREAGFYILKTAPSAAPNVLDRENRDLMSSVERFRLALAISSPSFRPFEALGATGGNPDGDVDVRTTFRYPRIWGSPASRREQVGSAQVHRAAGLTGALESVPRTTRMWKAIVCFSRGAESGRGDDRLHNFVRCIEGFIAPDIGKTKKHFRNRVGSVVADVTQEVLGEIFDLRSAVEHLNDPGEVLAGKKKEAAFFRRVDEVEAIARFCILTVLEKPRLLDMFKSDEGIKAFWREKAEWRRQHWGPQLELEEALAHLRYDGETPGR